MSKETETMTPKTPGRSLRAILVAAIAATAMLALAAGAAAAPFELTRFDGGAFRTDGEAATQAGSHPGSAWTEFRFSQEPRSGPKGLEEYSTGTLKDTTVALPAGLVGDPQAVPACTVAEMDANPVACPPASQVGVVTLRKNGGNTNPGEPITFNLLPLYNIKAPFGTAGLLSFVLEPVPVYISAGVRTGGDYGITASALDAPTAIALEGVKVEIWGVPADHSHDALRGSCLPITGSMSSCSLASPEAASPHAFFTLPTSCTGPVSTSIMVTSWEGGEASGSFLSHAAGDPFSPVGNDDCGTDPFAPSLEARPTTNVADSPTGLDVDLHIPQPSTEADAADAPGRAKACTRGAWESDPSSFAFRWLRNGAPIPGAGSSSYQLTAADAGAAIQCEVIAANATPGQGRAASLPLAVEPATASALPSPMTVSTGRSGATVVTQPTISGTVTTAGGTLACDPKAGEWQGNPSFTFQWFVDGAEQAGKTAATYAVAAGEGPMTLQCRVTGTNGSGAAVAFSPTKAVTASTTPVPDPPIPSPPAPDPKIINSSIEMPSIGIADADIPRATAHLKDTTVTLPEGLVVNPSAANGLGACTEAQFGFTSMAGNVVHTTPGPATCPDDAKLGSVEVDTPLLDHPVQGSVYIAEPFENPFGTLLALYLTIDDPQSGVVVKLAGKVEANTQSGRLTATFKENPQLPFEDFHLRFFGGAGGSLRTPATCGTYSTESQLTPWSAPEGATVRSEDHWAIERGPQGNCAGDASQLPNSPSFEAGTVTPLSGTYSPFVMKLTRQDGSQELKGLNLTLPAGLTGKLAGIPYCSDAQIAQAQSRSKPGEGAIEQAHPSCPRASEVGTVTVGAGAGPKPYYAQGHAYLAGPYRGAPLSMAIVTPAVAGPFDLGTVVVRAALHVDPETAQITVKSDEIPHILEGIPLDVRSIAVDVGRSDFTLNPTNCEAKSVTGSAIALGGSEARLSNRFQVGECGALGFKPKLKLQLKGATKRVGHPALKAVLTYPQGGGYANIARAQVNLPHGEFLDQGNLNKTCTRPVLLAGACPASTVYGTVKAWTPLLEKPLEGNVYLVGGYGYKLPALVAELNGQVRVLLVGKVDSGKNKGIRNTFEVVPDAPVEKFELSMKGGKKYGLLENSENLCKASKKARRAIVSFTGQNGKVEQSKPVVANQCGKKGKKGKKHAGHRGGHNRSGR